MTVKVRNVGETRTSGGGVNVCPPMSRPHRSPGRHTHWRLARHRHRLLRLGGLAALLAVVGPRILAGLSDDDPAGVTTHSLPRAPHGYQLLLGLALSTAAVVVLPQGGRRLR